MREAKGDFHVPRRLPFVATFSGLASFQLDALIFWLNVGWLSVKELKTVVDPNRALDDSFAIHRAGYALYCGLEVDCRVTAT